jgi:hypothetical protein
MMVPMRGMGVGAGITALLIAAAAAASAGSGAADAPTMSVVLGRAGAYVSELQRRLSTIVAEERYVQTVWNLQKADRRVPLSRVELRSEFLLVKPDGSDRYVELRDTFEVDGRRVHDRRDRLSGLFTDRVSPSRSSVQDIISESARYNIGDITRTLNVPTLPLLFLHPRYQSRFKFERTKNTEPAVARLQEETAGTAAVFRVATEVWVIAYREVDEPTLVRTPEGRSRPVRGRFWIEPDTGRVLMSDLAAGDGDLRAEISVSYQSEPLLGFLVPIEMRERYEARKRNTLIEGSARYSAFRPLAAANATPGRP